MKTVAGIDLGTQSTKVIVYDYENKNIPVTASAPHELISSDDGTREQKTQWWTEALNSCFAKIPPEIKKTIQAIGVSGQQHGFVPLDAGGNALYNVKLWCDTSTSKDCHDITKKMGGNKKLLSKAGNLIVPGYTASKILWLKRNHRALYEKMRHILLPHDYINYYLTGNYTMEYGDASGTGFLNIRKKIWSKEILTAMDGKKDLLKCLPELIRHNESAGRVKKDIALKFGIPEGIPVSSGGGDNMMGAIGTGATRDGVLTMSLGTSGTLYGYSSKPVVDPEGNLAAFCSSTGGWLPLLCTMNCTVATELTRDLFKMDISELEKTVSGVPAGSNGIIMLPFFNGERTPNLPNGRGCIVGMNNSNTGMENILRASMESAIFGMRVGLESFKKLGFRPKQIRLTGGGSKNAVWRQIAADALNVPVVVPYIEEGAAFGAALQALFLLAKKRDINMITEIHVALDQAKSCSPVKENVAKYDSVYKMYVDYVKHLTNLFK